jgi:hypothetical protein
MTSGLLYRNDSAGQHSSALHSASQHYAQHPAHCSLQPPILIRYACMLASAAACQRIVAIQQTLYPSPTPCVCSRLPPSPGQGPAGWLSPRCLPPSSPPGAPLSAGRCPAPTPADEPNASQTASQPTCSAAGRSNAQHSTAQLKSRHALFKCHDAQHTTERHGNTAAQQCTAQNSAPQ